MKRLLFLIFAIIPFMGHSEVYFKEGMKWVNWIVGSHGPDTEISYQTFFIKGTSHIAEEEVLNMYMNSDYELEEKFIAYIRVENQKVFFKQDNSEDSQWFLMYDFGLETGDEFITFSPVLPLSWYEEGKYMVLDGYKSPEDASGWELMYLTMYMDNGSGEYKEYAEGSWIKNLCSTAGVVYNVYGYDGFGSGLVAVYDHDELIYSSPGFTSVQDVTSDIKMTDEIYNLQGVRMGCDVNALSPGIYIINGKKVVVR